MTVVKAAAHGVSSGGLGLVARFLLFASGRGVIRGYVKAMRPAVVVVLKTTHSATDDRLRFGVRSWGGGGDGRCGCVLRGDRRDAIEGELGLQGRDLVSVPVSYTHLTLPTIYSV